MVKSVHSAVLDLMFEWWNTWGYYNVNKPQCCERWPHFPAYREVQMLLGHVNGTNAHNGWENRCQYCWARVTKKIGNLMHEGGLCRQDFGTDRRGVSRIQDDVFKIQNSSMAHLQQFAWSIQQGGTNELRRKIGTNIVAMRQKYFVIQ